MSTKEASTDFHHQFLPALNKTVFRLGLAPSFGVDSSTVEQALAGPTNYLFWTPRMKAATAPLRGALAKDRQRYVVATGPTTALWAGNIRKFTENTLRQLNTDYLDILQMFWLGTTSRWTPSTVETLVKLREEGKVKTIGVSIHDRKRAGELAVDSPLDVLMIRYNAAHPGAETDIFPHLHHRNPIVVAYTATRWRKLLKRPRGWTKDVPTAGHCYRFCLSSPHVDLVLHGPANAEQLKENIDSLKEGPLTDDQQAWMRDFGKVVRSGTGVLF